MKEEYSSKIVIHDRSKRLSYVSIDQQRDDQQVSIALWITISLWSGNLLSESDARETNCGIQKPLSSNLIRLLRRRIKHPGKYN